MHLSEVSIVKPENDGRRKRWFSCADMDLFTWSDSQNNLQSFQLCYDKHQHEKVLVWSAERGWEHAMIDDGEQIAGRYKSTPVLIDTIDCDINRVIELFRELGADISRTVFEAVEQKLVSVQDSVTQKII